MNCHSNVQWNKTGSNLLINIKLDKGCKIKGDLSNIFGKCIMQVFNKSFKKGNHKIRARLKEMDKGIYTMKLSTIDDGNNVIRFMID